MLKLQIVNPKIEFDSKNSYSSDELLNEHINELMREDSMKYMSRYDEKIMSKLMNKYPQDKVEKISPKDSNTFSAFKKLEEELSEYESLYLLSFPDVSSSIFVMYSKPLKYKMKIPFLWCVSDYIDFLYCLYSYLLI